MTKIKKILAFTHFTNGVKATCSQCQRKHSNTYTVGVFKENELIKKEYYGSGCIKKQSVNQTEIYKALAKTLRFTSAEAYKVFNEITQGGEK